MIQNIDKKTIMTFQVIFKNDLVECNNSYVELYKKYFSKVKENTEKRGSTKQSLEENEKEYNDILLKIKMFIILNADNFSYNELFEIITYDLAFSRVHLKDSFESLNNENKTNYEVIMKNTSHM